MRVHAAVAVAVICYFLTCPRLRAQSDAATVSGRITDESGAAIAEAEVTASNIGSGIKVNTVTNEDGIYVVQDLHPGTYDLTVQKDGFRQVILTNLTLNVQDALSRNFTLQLGPQNESITVTASRIEEQSLSPAVGTLVDQQFVQNMPLNGRSFQSLLGLTPGYVIVVPTDSQPGVAPGQFSVNGQRANANYFIIDGVTANFSGFSGFSLGQTGGGTIPSFNIAGQTNGLVSVDAMQEFRVLTSTFSPEFGRQPGAQISIVTRSGSNQFHGTLFDYLRNDVFDARNYFDSPNLPKPPLRQNDFGGTFSGPIQKDRLFFFFSYEGLRLLLPETSIGTFYTAAARANVAPVYRPLVDALPIPNGPVNSDGLTAPLTMVYSDPTSFNNYSLRMDYSVNDHITLFGRYNHAPSMTSTHYASELDSQSANVDTLTVGSTMTFGPNKVNDLRANWSRWYGGLWSIMIPFYGAVPPPQSAMFPPGYNSTTSQFILLLGNDNEVRTGRIAYNNQRQLELVDAFSVSKGTHQLKFGADLRQLTPTSSPYTYSSLIFAANYSSLQQGIVDSVSTSANASIQARLYNYSLFAQDVWRATSKLTLTYGLRWEINTPLHSITPGKPLYAINGIFNSEPFGLAPPNVPLWHTHFTDFAPRVGAAYQATPQTIVRGGFGLFYDIGFGGGIANTMVYYPYQASSASSGPVPFDFSNPAFAPPTFPSSANPTSGIFSAVDPNLRLPLIYEWNVAVEQALGPNQSLSVTYLGAYGTRLIREDTIQFNPSGDPEVYATRNADWSHYNALQVQFQRHMYKGLQVLASYTLAHSEDTGSSDICQCTWSNSVQNINVGADYGPSDFDIRNAFAAAVSYEFPTPKFDNRATNAFLRGWAVYGVLHVNSAPPFGVAVEAQSPLFGYYGTRPNIVPGQPFYLPDASNPGGHILNPAAFAAPAPGEQGDLPRNYFRAFPTDQTDLAISRRFALSERFSLYFRVEYFNLFNHPMLAPPPAGFNNYISSPTFGQITQTQNEYYGGLSPLYGIGGPRSGQFTLRLQF
ncbi:MAG TPA: carboxypeptidase regulatory-like domain-containing protein [Candidatus Sulfotelmatobacter sp.]|nr:carboxypeptidase regulatory-like domain-containing protein [Candidatus Sulfotelmatobacter sp.]